MWVIVIAIEAIAGGQLLSFWVPLPAWQIGIALLTLLTLVNLASARSFGEFEFWFSLVKIVAILAFILIVAAHTVGLTSGSASGLRLLADGGGFAPFGPLSIFTGIVTVIFSMIGAEIATIAAAESEEGSRVIAGMTLRMILRIVAFYVISILLIVCVVPWSAIQPGDSPFALALEAVAIPHGATIMNLVVLIAVLSCLNSGIYVTSRILFGLAGHGDAPQALVKVNGRQVPVRAILISTVFGYAALFASIVSPSVVFAFLVNATGALSLIVYILLGFAHVAFRHATERRGGSILMPMWLFPWLSYATIGLIAAILGFMAISPALRLQFVSSAGSVVLVLIAYFIFQASRRGRSGGADGQGVKESLEPMA
jgi:GABA permease